MIKIPKDKQANKTLMSTIKAKNHPYGKHNIIGVHGYQLALKEYKRCLEFYENYGSFPLQTPISKDFFIKLIHNNFASLEEIAKIEINHKQELESLAKQIVSDFFNIPIDHFNDASISDDFELSPETPAPSESVDEKKMKKHINKRILLNSLVHGASVHLWKSIHFLYEEEIRSVNNKLFDKYTKLTADSSFLFWQIPPMSPEMQAFGGDILSNKHVKQGQNSITFNEDNDEPSISVKATNFQTMIHELIKATLDLVVLHGIDDSLSEQEQQYVFSKADRHMDEIWYYYTGAALWQMLMEEENPDSQDIPDLIMDISKSNINTTTKYFKNVISNNNS